MLCRNVIRKYRFHANAQALIFILASTVWFVIGLRPFLGGLWMAWNRDFHLLVGNESDRSRPWLGEIRYVGIYGRALTAEQVSRIHKNTVGTKNERQEPDLPEMLVGYDFTRGNSGVVSPVGSLASDNLSIQVPDGAGFLFNADGIVLKEPSVLATRGAASELTEAILSAGAFSVEAWIRPLNDKQEGPARIVTLSESVWSSNFMLGQEASDLVFRVRNGINGGNGFRFALHGKNAVQNGLQHVVAVYDHGVSSIFLDGRRIRPVVDLREPGAYLRLGIGPVGRFFSMMLLILTVALPCYSIFSFMGRAWVRHAGAIVSTICIGGLPYTVSSLSTGGPLRLGFFLWLVVCGSDRLSGLFFLCVYASARMEQIGENRRIGRNHERIHESGHSGGGQGDPAGGGNGDPAQAHGGDRWPADPVAHHEALFPLRLQRIRDRPRVSRRVHQALDA